MEWIETKYFSYCKAGGILWAINQDQPRQVLTMNSNLIQKSIVTAALVTVALTGLANIEISLPVIGTAVAYLAAAAIFTFAAFEGVRRSS